ncbi:MAG: hypothetical protein L0Z50_38405 [Verrucomicrobiales bacterium]|nr:hypothetical protein [Verrucomicrobiales bacterium]
MVLDTCQRPRATKAWLASNLALDQATAAKIRAQPELAEIAKANLRRWMRHDGGFVHPVHEEWMDILNFLTPTEIADFI